jgi:aspartyl-tRNA(Asn)/glutamyl-tRNA(Gln) amidotransferase subunit A
MASATDLNSLSASEMRAGLAAKSFSSLELTEAAIKKMTALKDLNCFIETCPDFAREEARRADQTLAAGKGGPLTGVPIAIKDAICTKGIRTTSGSKILGNFVPPYDATVITKLKAAGAVIVGKTNMDEFAMGSSNENSGFGPVKNPWKTANVPGGSSGGSAAAVAAQMVPLALGSDTGGSIRQPASLCSLVGLKPTYGRVSRYGLIAYASSLDQIGPMARTAEDCAALLQVLSGRDENDSTSMDIPVPDFAAELKKPVAGVRIGIPKEYFIGGLQKEVEASIRAAIAQLEKMGAKTVEVSLPHTELALSVYYILAPAEASSNLARFDGVRYGYRAAKPEDLKDLYVRTRSEGFGPEVQRRIMIGTHVLSTGYFDAYYLKAQKVRMLIAQDFKNAFAEKCDVILCPTSPTTAFAIGAKVEDPLAMYLNDVFTIPVNLAGLPGINVPCGFDGAGLPIGLQLIGKPWDEALLLRLAHVYERANEWYKRHPKI